MYQPKVSIIIPVYNGANYLSESIESALAQTYPNLEVIVVNDGSKDEGASEAIAKRYEAQGKIRYFAKPNGGVSSALNLGISKMEGEWASWLSHDDLYLPTKIEEQITYLNTVVIPRRGATNIEKVILYCNTDFINDKGEVILKLKPIAKEFEPNINILLKNLKKNRLGGCSFLVHKKAMDAQKGFNEGIRTVSDYDLWYRFLLNDYEFFYVPKTLVLGRMHKKQVTYTLSEVGYREFEQFHTWLLQQMDQKKSYNHYPYFFKVACYARQRGYFESAKLGYQMMKKRSPFPVYWVFKTGSSLYNDLYRISKRTLKKVYAKLYIK